MADEIKVTAKITISNGFLSESLSTSSISVDQTGTGAVGGVQNIGTSAEAIDVGDVSTLGYAFFRNVSAVEDPVAYIQIGQNISAGGFEEFLRLNAGEVALLRLDLAAGGVLQAKATTSAQELQYKIYEE